MEVRALIQISSPVSHCALAQAQFVAGVNGHHRGDISVISATVCSF